MEDMQPSSDSNQDLVKIVESLTLDDQTSTHKWQTRLRVISSPSGSKGLTDLNLDTQFYMNLNYSMVKIGSSSCLADVIISQDKRISPA